MSFPERKRLLPVFSEKKQDANCAVPLRFERTHRLHRLACLTPFRAADRKTSWKTGDGSSCTVPLVIWIVYYSLRKISVRLYFFKSSALFTKSALTEIAPFTYGFSFSAVLPMPLPPDVANA